MHCTAPPPSAKAAAAAPAVAQQQQQQQQQASAARGNTNECGDLMHTAAAAQLDVLERNTSENKKEMFRRWKKIAKVKNCVFTIPAASITTDSSASTAFITAAKKPINHHNAVAADNDDNVATYIRL